MGYDYAAGYLGLLLLPGGSIVGASAAAAYVDDSQNFNLGLPVTVVLNLLPSSIHQSTAVASLTP